jgi:hypothetical protein
MALSLRLFDDVVTPEYVVYGHEPPSLGSQGSRDDSEHVLETIGDADTLRHRCVGGRRRCGAVAGTGHLPDGSEFRGLNLYRVRDGKVTKTRHTSIGPPPG